MSRIVSRQLLIGVAIGAALAVAAGALFLQRGPKTPPGGGPAMPSEARRALYHCPMHPTMVSDRPGDCPICGMRMVPMEEDAPAAGGQPPAGAEASPGAAAGVAADAGPAPEVEGLATVRIPVRKQQLIGVRTTVATRRPFVRTQRTVGRVTADETRLHHVHTKISGWVEQLHVNATGEKVRAGQPLLTIYSPELLATQEEYLLALRARGGLDAGGLPEVARRADDLVESARRRLLLFDMTPEQIATLEGRGTAERTVTLYAPTSGHVLSRNVTHGQKIDPDTALLDIADLSRVWVMAAIYEYELPFVRLGQKARMTLSYLPGRAYDGRVTLIHPVLEEGTRTVQVRLEFANPDLDLRPGMYADVEIRSDLGEHLGLPEGAVLSSGTRHIVFVEKGEGVFEPREVRIGLRLPDAVQVIEGLREGETVVSSGTFFVDSESRLKAALEDATALPGGPAHQH
jgi:multidrug efflux pump subunit AcrA (membrane-fusion protein)